MRETVKVQANSRLPHLVRSAGFTALSGLGWGLQAGLLLKNPEVGLYFAPGGVTMLAISTCVGVIEWENFHEALLPENAQT